MLIKAAMTMAATAALLGGFSISAQAAPPYTGTAFIAPKLITESDPTTFLSLTDAGRGTRTLFDRRVNAFITVNAYLFQASYANGQAIEFQINPEFGNVGAARQPVAFYAPVIGRLPGALLPDVHAVWIHKGDEAFGGGNDSLLIHTGALAQSYIAQGILQETLAHEAAHTSLDADIAASPEWTAAQLADNEFISTYARDNPSREDVAESLVPYLMVCCGQGRVAPTEVDLIKATIPNRLRFFHSFRLELSPLVDDRPIFVDGFDR